MQGDAMAPEDAKDPEVLPEGTPPELVKHNTAAQHDCAASAHGKDLGRPARGE